MVVFAALWCAPDGRVGLKFNANLREAKSCVSQRQRCCSGRMVLRDSLRLHGRSSGNRNSQRSRSLELGGSSIAPIAHGWWTGGRVMHVRDGLRHRRRDRRSLERQAVVQAPRRLRRRRFVHIPGGMHRGWGLLLLGLPHASGGTLERSGVVKATSSARGRSRHGARRSFVHIAFGVHRGRLHRDRVGGGRAAHGVRGTLRWETLVRPDSPDSHVGRQRIPQRRLVCVANALHRRRHERWRSV